MSTIARDSLPLHGSKLSWQQVRQAGADQFSVSFSPMPKTAYPRAMPCSHLRAACSQQMVRQAARMQLWLLIKSEITTSARGRSCPRA